MQDILPRDFDLSWTERLCVQNYQSIQSRSLNDHTKAILTLCQPTMPLKQTELGNSAFWDGLKSNQSRSNDVKKLFEHWKKISPLAHLNAKQLIRLLQNEIYPLIKAYDRVLFELNDESEYAEYFPGFLNAVKNEIIAETKENLKRIERLKQHIYYGLAARAGAYKTLKAKRQCDDVVSAISTEINALKILETPLKIEPNLESGMDDNQRLTTYDILRKLDPKRDGVEIQDLDKIIRPIPKKLIKAFRTRSSVKDERESLEKFIQKRLREDQEKQWASWIKQVPPFIGFYVNFAWRWRLVIMAIAVYLIIQPILPLKIMYGILSLTIGFSTWEVYKDRAAHWKNQEIHGSLIMLSHSKQLIDYQLMQTPLDLEHFDVDYLTNQIEKIKSQLSQESRSLKKASFIQKWILPNEYFGRMRKVSKQCDVQNIKLKQSVEKMASYISDRIGQEVESGQFSVEAFKRWQSFVKKHGSSASIARFDKNADMVLRWGKQIGKLYIKSKNVNEIPNGAPWGSFPRREDLLKQWGKLIHQWVSPDKRRDACENLHQLLQGKKVLSVECFKKAIADLKVDALQAAYIKSAIQNYLFETFSFRPPQTALLLTSEQQLAIKHYRQAHMSEIESAKCMMKKIMETMDTKNYPDHALITCFRWLDVEDYYKHIISKSQDRGVCNNLVRKLLESYQGETDNILQFLRFVFGDERSQYANMIADKRRMWLEDHGGIPSYLSDNDAIIFNNHWVLDRKWKEARVKEKTSPRKVL